VNLQERGVESNLIVLPPGEIRHFLVSVTTHSTES
jgi:hypothetical protein